MRIRHSKSHIQKRCVACNNLTGSSKIYEESGISLRVPVCAREESPSCHEQVIVKSIAKDLIREVKAEIGLEKIS